MKRLLALAAAFAGLAIWLARYYRPTAIEIAPEPPVSPVEALPAPDPYQWGLMGQTPSLTAHHEPGSATLVHRDLYRMPWQ